MGSDRKRLAPAAAFISPEPMRRSQEAALESANRAAREIDQA
jgi:hypothetical protein